MNHSLWSVKGIADDSGMTTTLKAVTGCACTETSYLGTAYHPRETMTVMSKTSMVWVVDDDPELRKMVGTYLIDQGYDVRCLSDVKQLEARLECQRPDLLVLDVMLPGDDGLTALRRLRDAGDDLPVVMLTARGEAVDRIIGLEQGADDYLGKPFLPRELTARIDAVLRRRMAIPAGTPLVDGEQVRFGENVLDLSARTLMKGQHGGNHHQR